MIEFYVHQNKFAIPNAWEELTPGLFEGIMADMDLVIKGELSPAMLQVKHICRAMGDRKSTRLNSSHRSLSRMPSSA